MARSPTLDTVLMVEKLIEKKSGEYNRTQLWKILPKKVMWQTYLVILDYLKSINKIGFDRKGQIAYISESETYQEIAVKTGDQGMKVVFVDVKLEKDFTSLKDSDPIKKSICKTIKRIQADSFSGMQIAKRLIPKVYVRKYGINNLWKSDLVDGWRLLYTISADDVEVIAAILEWFNHKKYKRRMGYII